MSKREILRRCPDRYKKAESSARLGAAFEQERTALPAEIERCRRLLASGGVRRLKRSGGGAVDPPPGCDSTLRGLEDVLVSFCSKSTPFLVRLRGVVVRDGTRYGFVAAPKCGPMLDLFEECGRPKR